MNFLNKMERKFGKYAIKNLTYYIIGAYVLGLLIYYANSGIYYNYLSLDASAILHGQIWRIITFIIAPPSTSIFFMFFVLYLYYMIGTSLERTWGAFRFNVYFFMGVLLHVIAAILIYLSTGIIMSFDTYYLNMSLFLAFAAMFPDMKLMLFFVIPIKIKWLGIIDAIYFGIVILSGFVSYFVRIDALYAQYAGMGYDYDTLRVLALAKSVAALVSLLNFIIFFFAARKHKSISPSNIYRKAKYKRESAPQKKNPQGTRHKCAVCGKTELDGEDLVFRYCSKCEGNFEYCQDHLFTHQHVHK